MPALVGCVKSLALASTPPLSPLNEYRVGKVFKALGSSVGVVLATDETPAAQAAFAADVTYITAQQLGFTYLRDNMARDASRLVRADRSHVPGKGRGRLMLWVGVGGCGGSGVQGAPARRPHRQSRVPAFGDGESIKERRRGPAASPASRTPPPCRC